MQHFEKSSSEDLQTRLLQENLKAFCAGIKLEINRLSAKVDLFETEFALQMNSSLQAYASQQEALKSALKQSQFENQSIQSQLQLLQEENLFHQERSRQEDSNARFQILQQQDLLQQSNFLLYKQLHAQTGQASNSSLRQSKNSHDSSNSDKQMHRSSPEKPLNSDEGARITTLKTAQDEISPSRTFKAGETAEKLAFKKNPPQETIGEGEASQHSGDSKQLFQSRQKSNFINLEDSQFKVLNLSALESQVQEFKEELSSLAIKNPQGNLENIAKNLPTSQKESFAQENSLVRNVITSNYESPEKKVENIQQHPSLLAQIYLESPQSNILFVRSKQNDSPQPLNPQNHPPLGEFSQKEEQIQPSDNGSPQKKKQVEVESQQQVGQGNLINQQANHSNESINQVFQQANDRPDKNTQNTQNDSKIEEKLQTQPCETEDLQHDLNGLGSTEEKILRQPINAVHFELSEENQQLGEPEISSTHRSEEKVEPNFDDYQDSAHQKGQDEENQSKKNDSAQNFEAIPDQTFVNKGIPEIQQISEENAHCMPKQGSPDQQDSQAFDEIKIVEEQNIYNPLENGSKHSSRDQIGKTSEDATLHNRDDQSKIIEQQHTNQDDQLQNNLSNQSGEKHNQSINKKSDQEQPLESSTLKDSQEEQKFEQPNQKDSNEIGPDCLQNGSHKAETSPENIQNIRDQQLEPTIPTTLLSNNMKNDVTQEDSSAQKPIILHEILELLQKEERSINQEKINRCTFGVQREEEKQKNFEQQEQIANYEQPDLERLSSPEKEEKVIQNKNTAKELEIQQKLKEFQAKQQESQQKHYNFSFKNYDLVARQNTSLPNDLNSFQSNLKENPFNQQTKQNESQPSQKVSNPLTSGTFSHGPHLHDLKTINVQRMNLSNSDSQNLQEEPPQDQYRHLNSNRVSDNKQPPIEANQTDTYLNRSSSSQRKYLQFSPDYSSEIMVKKIPQDEIPKILKKNSPNGSNSSKQNPRSSPFVAQNGISSLGYETLGTKSSPNTDKIFIQETYNFDSPNGFRMKNSSNSEKPFSFIQHDPTVQATTAPSNFHETSNQDQRSNDMFTTPQNEKKETKKNSNIQTIKQEYQQNVQTIGSFRQKQFGVLNGGWELLLSRKYQTNQAFISVIGQIQSGKSTIVDGIMQNKLRFWQFQDDESLIKILRLNKNLWNVLVLELSLKNFNYLDSIDQSDQFLYQEIKKGQDIALDLCLQIPNLIVLVIDQCQKEEVDMIKNLKKRLITTGIKKRLLIVHNYKSKFYQEDLQASVYEERLEEIFGILKISEGYYANTLQEREILKQDHFIIGSIGALNLEKYNQKLIKTLNYLIDEEQRHVSGRGDIIQSIGSKLSQLAAKDDKTLKVEQQLDQTTFLWNEI